MDIITDMSILIDTIVTRGAEHWLMRIHTRTHTRTHTLTCTHAYTHTHNASHIRTYVHTHTHIHTPTHAYKHSSGTRGIDCRSRPVTLSLRNKRSFDHRISCIRLTRGWRRGLHFPEPCAPLPEPCTTRLA